MKKTMLTTTAILLILAGIVACGKEKEEKQPTEIPLTEYALSGSNCQWTNLDYNDSVIVINNKTELEKYITCTEETFPEIDFSKHTLLLASGGTTQSVYSINTNWYKYSAAEYELAITVVMAGYMVAQGWSVSILVPKIQDNAEVDIKVDYAKLNHKR
jgi:hypothetical protein